MKKRNEYHIYRYKKYTSKDLQELFQVVGWLSADYPERLKKALDKERRYLWLGMVRSW